MNEEQERQRLLESIRRRKERTKRLIAIGMAKRDAMRGECAFTKAVTGQSIPKESQALN